MQFRKQLNSQKLDFNSSGEKIDGAKTAKMATKEDSSIFKFIFFSNYQIHFF